MLDYAPLSELFEQFYTDYRCKFSNETRHHELQLDIELGLSMTGLSVVCDTLERIQGRAVHDVLVDAAPTRIEFWKVTMPALPRGLVNQVHVRFRTAAPMQALSTMETVSHSTIAAYLSLEIDGRDMYAEDPDES